jgi:ABC-2 type transport system permease protein
MDSQQQKAKMKKYFAIFRVTLINSLAYPAELIGRSLIILPFMWIFFQLWRVTFTASNAEVINGLTLHDTLWYLMLAETIELSRPRLGNTISEAVKDGSIAYFLNKPYDFLLYHFSTSMGETIFRAVLNALLGGAAVWWLVGSPPAAWGWPLAAIAIFGAWTLNFCISGMIGLAAFAVEDISAFQWIYQKFAFIFGGLLIPLDFYPAWLRTICNALPFSAMTYAPARLFVTPSLTAFVAVMGMQLAWTLALALLLTFFYRRSLVRLTVNGG